MRLTTETWVSALVRRVHGDGGFAAIIRRGNAQAGAIFVIARRRQGIPRLLVPAPQSLVETDERTFVERAVEDEAEIQKVLDGELRFDSDLWIVECEGLDKPLDNYLNLESSE